MDIVLQSNRLAFRKIVRDDVKYLRPILQDIDIMYAWEHPFTDAEVHEWIDENINRYKNEGFSYFAAIEKTSDDFIGVTGPLIEKINGVSAIGLAYILDKKHWHKGYAFEGAAACMDYAFSTLHAPKVIAQIRPSNRSSRKVAQKLGMQLESEYNKYYQGKEMPHLIYAKLKSSP